MRDLLPKLENLPLWPTIAAPVFFALFIGIVWWVYRSKRRVEYKNTEALPLEDD